MKTSTLVKATLLSLVVTSSAHPKHHHHNGGNSSQPLALVYRGPAACQGCPEAVAHLLTHSPSEFKVTYVGPHDHAITKHILNKADVFAQPGGGSIGKTWPHMEPYKNLIRDWVSDGGRYMGFCLGAYFIGKPGYEFLPKGDNTNQEITQPGAQVNNSKNEVLQVDWTFHTGEQAGTTEERWMFYQDGPVMLLRNPVPNGQILARYASNQNIAATLTPFGKGWVGATGPHPEANKSWYPKGLVNPDGINFTIGYDFVETVYKWPNV